MIGYIYLTTNEVNDIVYVGKRQKPYFEKSYKGSGTHLKLAFSKYGKDKFHTIILEWCETKEELCSAEMKWIAFYKENGYELYNITDGGGGTTGISWRRFPPEKVEEILRKNSESHKGAKNPFYGRKHSEETRKLLRAHNKNRGMGLPKQLAKLQQEKRSKLREIVQIEKRTGTVIKTWKNWCEAGKAMSSTNRCAFAHIAECCRGERRSAYGYKWAFAEVMRE